MTRNTGLLTPNYAAANAELDAFEIACYQAGQDWAKAGNTKLPRFAEVNGTKVPVIKSIGVNGQAFVRGWKSAKA